MPKNNQYNRMLLYLTLLVMHCGQEKLLFTLLHFPHAIIQPGNFSAFIVGANRQKSPQISLKETPNSAAHVHQLLLIFKAEWTQLLSTVLMSEEARKACAEVAVAKTEVLTFRCQFFHFLWATTNSLKCLFNSCNQR